MRGRGKEARDSRSERFDSSDTHEPISIDGYECFVTPCAKCIKDIYTIGTQQTLKILVCWIRTEGSISQRQTERER